MEVLVLENTVRCADEKSQNGVLRAQLRKAFASSRQLGTSAGQPWETSESRVSTVPSETGKRKKVALHLWVLFLWRLEAL